jgi:hypothetical protein
MGLFGKGKTLPEKAEDERAKLEMKRLKLANKNTDIAMIEAEKRKRAEQERLTA